MREMVLNHASLGSPDQHTAVGWLKEVTVGMTMLVKDEIAKPTLRMRQAHADILCLSNWSLWDALQELRKGGARDEHLFFARLTSKVPLLCDIDQEVADRFRACEATILPPKDGEPLVLCAITDGIAVGFPSAPVWDCDQLTIHFDELLPDGSIGEASEMIDNLTRFAHVQPICERHRAGLRDQFTNAAALWNGKEQVFPNLIFGPDVEDHLSSQFKEAFAKLPQRIQRRAKKQLVLFFENYRYPSLQTKKMEGHNDLFEGRITRDYRFIYRMTGDTCYIIDIGTHDVLNRY